MITQIARLLQARKPHAPQEWVNKLPHMARRLEESLFRNAESFPHYQDAATLKRRLQNLAMTMRMNKQAAAAAGGAYIGPSQMQQRPANPAMVCTQASTSVVVRLDLDRSPRPPC